MFPGQAEIELLQIQYPGFFMLLREASYEGLTFEQRKSGQIHACRPNTMSADRFKHLTTEFSNWHGVLVCLSHPPSPNLTIH